MSFFSLFTCWFELIFDFVLTMLLLTLNTLKCKLGEANSNSCGLCKFGLQPLLWDAQSSSGGRGQEVWGSSVIFLVSHMPKTVTCWCPCAIPPHPFCSCSGSQPCWPGQLLWLSSLCALPLLLAAAGWAGPKGCSGMLSLPGCSSSPPCSWRWWWWVWRWQGVLDGKAAMCLPLDFLLKYYP